MNVLQQGRGKITAGIGSHTVTSTQHERPLRALALTMGMISQILREGAGLGTLVACVQAYAPGNSSTAGEVFVSSAGDRESALDKARKNMRLEAWLLIGANNACASFPGGGSGLSRL